MTTVKSKQGFTILEVIISISIMAVGLIATASMQAAAVKATAGAFRISESATLAQDRMEVLLSRPYRDPMLAPGAHRDPSPPAGYSISWNVVDDSPVANTKRLEVTVSWKEGRAERTTTLRCVKPELTGS